MKVWTTAHIILYILKSISGNIVVIYGRRNVSCALLERAGNRMTIG